MKPSAWALVTVTVATTAAAPTGMGPTPAMGTRMAVLAATGPLPPSARDSARVSRRRDGATPWNEVPPGPNHPVTSTTRSVCTDENRHTRRLGPSGTRAVFDVGS